MTLRSVVAFGVAGALSVSFFASRAAAQTPGGGPPPPPAYPSNGAVAPGAPPPVGYPPAPLPQPGYPPNAAPAYAPPPPLQPPFAVPQVGPQVRLQTNNSRARLQQEFQLRWRDICVAPCGAVVDPNGTYRIGGGTLRPTDPFRMPRPSGVVLVDAHLGSNVKRWVGVGLTIGAGLAFASAAYYLWGSPRLTARDDGTDNRDVFRAIGIVEIVTGAILAGVGIGLIAAGGTSVDVR
jgi:hypothetical protein